MFNKSIKKMKKYILLAVSAIVLAFTSCTDGEEIDIKYQVDVTINPSTVKSAFHGYFAQNETYGLDMYEGAELLISAYIYDNNGLYLDKKEFFVEDYTSKANFSLVIPEDEKYTIVCITHSVLKSSELSSYKIENYDERIEDLKISSNFPNGNSYYSNWSMLGLEVRDIQFNENNVVVDVSPASSLVVVRYMNIHAWDEFGIDRHQLQYSNNDYVSFANKLPEFKTNLTGNSAYTASVDVTENPQANNIFEIFYLLPTKELLLEGAMFSGENKSFYSNWRQTIGEDPSYGYTRTEVKAGCEYVFKLDCGNLAVSVEQLNASKSIKTDINVKEKQLIPSSIESSQSIDVMSFIK